MTTVDQLLSPNDCAAIVRQSGKYGSDFKVIGFRADKLAGHPGYLGEYSFLIITIVQANGEEAVFRCFLKTLPFSDPEYQRNIEEWGIFRKEADIYRDLFAKLEFDPAKVQRWRPQCYLARDELIVMEDLGCEGFRAMPFQKDFTEMHIRVVLDAMAQMHACSLQHEIRTRQGASIEDDYGRQMLFETTFLSSSPWFVAGLSGIRAIAEHGTRFSSNPEYKAVIDERLWVELERVYELAKLSDEFQSVLVHRDLWLNNIMFQFADSSCDTPLGCVLIDFQMTRYLPPAVDVLSTIYLLTNRPHRKHMMDEYIEYYYRTLKNKLQAFELNIDTVLNKQQFYRSLEHYKWYALVWAGVLLPFVNLPAGVLDELHISNPDAYRQFCIVNRDEFILQYYEKDAFYRESLKDIVEEILEYAFQFD